MKLGVDLVLSVGRWANANYIDIRLIVQHHHTGQFDLYLMFAPLCWHLTWYRHNRSFVTELGPFKFSLFWM